MAEGPLALRPAAECRWDLVAAGEVMLRLDPGDGRIATTRNFQAWEGGGEYNVARGLRRCFGLRTAVVTALVDNPIGRLIEDLLLQGGVDISHLRWAPFDGIGRSVRNGLNFTERGFGARAALGCSDRANSATSQLQPGEVPWDEIFVSEGARWFHTGGIFAGLSETTAAVAAEAMSAARQAGTTVSYDLNFRPSLWKAAGGAQRAVEVNRRLVAMTDVLFGNGDDFSSALGFDAAGAGPTGAGPPVPAPTSAGADQRRAAPAPGRPVPRLTSRAMAPCWPGWRPSSRPSRWSPAASDEFGRLAATTGAPSAGRGVSFMPTTCPTTSKSWTASVGATPSPPGSFMAC